MNNQVRLGLRDVSSRKLGNATDGYLDSLRSGGTNNLVNGNITDAQTVVNKVIDEVSSMRGRIGAFQSFTVDSALNSLNVALENTSAAESLIRDTDFAAETASLTRNQILVQAATSALAVSNSRPQSILQLLG
jgi:flagellin